MVNRIHTAYNAADRSYFAILKKEIHASALSAGFSEHKIGKIDLVVAELVSNLIKHAGGGRVLVKLIEENGLQGIEIMSVDSGPGMGDLSRMMTDGMSSKNTLGHGLGSMKRMADFLQVYSLRDWGTIVLTRFFEEPPQFSALRKKPAVADVRSVILPKPGEKACGDGMYSDVSASHVRVLLGDGLGHGPEAAKAVETAGEAFLACRETNPAEIIRVLNSAVKKTRGLVGTVAVLDIQEMKWRLCGVGNIMTRIVSPAGSRNHSSYNGIIGLNVPSTLNAQETAYEKGQQLFMCSDGLKTRWEVTRHPAILRNDPSISAAILVKDFSRNTDDMSAVVIKPNL
jgi:anti-sigma regulatory factor (Ser/Thr protein kinase)